MRPIAPERRPLDRMAIRNRPTKDGRPSWYAVVRDSRGKQVWIHCGPRKKDAEAVDWHVKQKTTHGIWTQPASRRFDQFVRGDFLDYKRPRVREKTYAGYEQDCRNHQIPFYGKSKLERITLYDVERFLSCLQGKGLSPRSINKQLVLSRMIFNRAIVLGFLQVNPAQFVDRVREPHKEMAFLTPEEIRAFLAVLPEEHRTLFILAILTGLRQAEIFGLRWSDYDPVRGLLFVRRTYNPEFGFMETKSAGSRRSVVVSPVLQRSLDEHRRNNGGNPEELIFRNRAGNPMNGQNLVTRVFHPALKNAGVKRIRFHDLRHTYAALMLSSNCGLKFLQQQMGHASIQTSLDLYGHLLPQASEGVASRLDELVFEEGIRPALQLIPGGRHERVP